MDMYVLVVDGRVDMASKGYLPLLVLSQCMLLLEFYNVLPLVLLALYPATVFNDLLIAV